MRYIITVILPVLLLFFHNIVAQETGTFNIDSVRVVSLQVPQLLKETGRSLSVISNNTIARWPVNSPDELLRYVPGVEIQSREGFGIQTDLSIRGSTFSQVLVLVDGMRINDPLTGHFNNDVPVSPAEIERIEIIMGPASALYGADAVGGVINIVTRTFMHNPSQQTTQTDGELLIGDHRLLSGKAGITMVRPRSMMSGGVVAHTSPDFPLENSERSDFDLRLASASISLALRKNLKLSFRLAANYKDFNAKNFYTTSPADSARETIFGNWTQVRILHTGERSRTSMDFALKTNHDEYLFNPISPINRHTIRYGNFQVTHYTNWSQSLLFSYGLQTSIRTIHSTDRGNHAETQAGAFGVVFYKPIHTVSCTGSLRIEYNEFYGTCLLPQVSVSWQTGKWTIHASSGKSTRSPDFTERFVGTALPYLAPGRNLGNPGLNVEKAWTIDAGTDLEINKNVNAGITVFTRNNHRLIDYVMTNSDLIPRNNELVKDTGYFYAQNISRLVTQGTEMYCNLYFPVNKLDIQTIFGLTLLHSSNESTLISKYISNHAKQIITTVIHLDYKRFSASLNGLWKIRNASELAPLIDEKLSRSYMVWSSNAEIDIYRKKLFIRFQVQNMLNEHYSDILGAPMPGRWSMGGIRWKF